MNDNEKKTNELITKIEAELSKTGVAWASGFKLSFDGMRTDTCVILEQRHYQGPLLLVHVELYQGGSTNIPLINIDYSTKLNFLLQLPTFIQVYFKHVKQTRMSEEDILREAALGLELIQKLNHADELSRIEKAGIR